MPRRLLRLLITPLLTCAPLTSACATDGVDDTCETILLGAALLPCVVAWGVGCVAGAGTRCCEGPSPSPDDLPEAAPSSSSASSSSLESAPPARSSAPGAAHAY